MIMSRGKAQDTGMEGWAVFHPPSEKFVPIEIQAHKSLPRFGLLDHYMHQNQGSKSPIRQLRGANGPKNMERSKRARNGLLNFSLLVSLKYLAPFMDDLDRERLTMARGNAPQEEQNSMYLQRFLHSQVAPNLCMEEACKNANRGENEFERLRNYKSFVKLCLNPLQKWSREFFKNDELVGYHVSVLNVGNGYDFDKKGYWVRHYFNLNDVFTAKQGGVKRVVFRPVATYENELLKKLSRKSSAQFFLKIGEQAAERFLKTGINRLYLVKKIKLKRSDKPMSIPSDPVEFSYSHVNQEWEIYEDLALTKHFTTLSLTNLTIKTN